MDNSAAVRPVPQLPCDRDAVLSEAMQHDRQVVWVLLESLRAAGIVPVAMQCWLGTTSQVDCDGDDGLGVMNEVFSSTGKWVFFNRRCSKSAGSLHAGAVMLVPSGDGCSVVGGYGGEASPGGFEDIVQDIIEKSCEPASA
jgi:hypothetical protein